jgi:hypothetical protein
MFVQTMHKTHARCQATRRHQFVSMFIGLVFATVLYPAQAHAQIVGDLEADVPFQFHAGNAKFPAGKYIIHTLDTSDLNEMEISSADGSHSALFEVRSTQANSTPSKSELIFNKYGNRYFLEKLFDEGEPSGSELIESNYEKRVGKAAAEAQQHVPAHHRAQH